MLDIHTRESTGCDYPIARNVEFFRIELASLNDGEVSVSMTATTVGEDEPELLDQEIARGRAATIDDVLELIRTHVRIVAPLRPAP